MGRALRQAFGLLSSAAAHPLVRQPPPTPTAQPHLPCPLPLTLHDLHPFSGWLVLTRPAVAGFNPAGDMIREMGSEVTDLEIESARVDEGREIGARPELRTTFTSFEFLLIYTHSFIPTPAKISVIWRTSADRKYALSL
jgi:hypothetical protein